MLYDTERIRLLAVLRNRASLAVVRLSPCTYDYVHMRFSVLAVKAANPSMAAVCLMTALLFEAGSSTSDDLHH